ncbi:unnamed protein product [Caretta caretta]
MGRGTQDSHYSNVNFSPQQHLLFKGPERKLPGEMTAAQMSQSIPGQPRCLNACELPGAEIASHRVSAALAQGGPALSLGQLGGKSDRTDRRPVFPSPGPKVKLGTAQPAPSGSHARSQREGMVPGRALGHTSRKSKDSREQRQEEGCRDCPSHCESDSSKQGLGTVATVL